MNLDSKENLFKQALDFILKGELENAKNSFFNLIAIDSENLEYQAGFYNVGWWLNRKEAQEIYKEGRAKATWLVKEWNTFSEIVNSRSFNFTKSYNHLMNFVLTQAVENYRKAFQEGGENAKDPNLLKELSICLLQLKDYENAIEILQYAKNKTPNDAPLNFLLAEVLCFTDTTENIKKGLTIYREAFLQDFHNHFKPEELQAEFTSTLYEKVLSLFENESQKAKYWFASFLMALAVSYQLPHLKNSEIEKILSETKRLVIEKDRTNIKFKDKVDALLCFYLLVLIIHFLEPNRDPFILQTYEKELYAISPTLYNFYVSHRDNLQQ